MNARPFKQDDLRKYCECKVCHNKIGQLSIPIFWIIETQRHGVKENAIRRHTSLEQLIGSAAIARAMGTDEDMTVVLQEGTIMVCDICMMERLPEIFEDSNTEVQEIANGN